MKEQNYVILTDSTTDISQAIADEINVKVWPMQFELDGLAYRNFPDEREMKSDDFYDLMRSGKMPKTSQINVVDFCEYFSEYLEKGLDILYICFSSGLSGTYNNSLIAIEELKEKYPDATIGPFQAYIYNFWQKIYSLGECSEKTAGMLDTVHAENSVNYAFDRLKKEGVVPAGASVECIKYNDSDDLAHIVRLAQEKKVPIEYYPLTHYKTCGIIKKLADA